MSPSDSLPTVICDWKGNLIMKRRISEEELFLVITRDRLSEMFEEAGANGLTFPETIETAFPGLDEDECLRLAAILEHATTGKMPVYTSIN